MLTIDASRTTTKSAIASNTSAHQRRSTRRVDAVMLVVIDILRPLIEAALVGQEAARPRSPDAHDRSSAVGVGVVPDAAFGQGELSSQERCDFAPAPREMSRQSRGPQPERGAWLRYGEGASRPRARARATVSA